MNEQEIICEKFPEDLKSASKIIYGDSSRLKGTHQ